VAAPPIDVVLADDDAMVRAGLRPLLEESSAIRVVAEASNVPAVFDVVRAHRPAVAILDLDMPGGSMLDAIRVPPRSGDRPSQRRAGLPRGRGARTPPSDDALARGLAKAPEDRPASAAAFEARAALRGA
jgi:CheY-like chemotaxis protein